MNASDDSGNQLLKEKMLLRCNYIKFANRLIPGYVFEWDTKLATVLGPIVQTGPFNPAMNFLIWSFPRGSQVHVTQSEADKLEVKLLSKQIALR